MPDKPDEPKQTTPAGQTIPVPKRGDFDAMVRKIAPPASDSPGKRDKPRDQSER